MADTNAQTFDMEVAILQRRVSELETELQEKDQDLFTAAQLGNKLLDSNQELETRLEELAKEYSEKIEVGQGTTGKLARVSDTFLSFLRRWSKPSTPSS